jgi:hypothetical protein
VRIELQLRLRNVFGGDGFTRPHEVEEVKLARTKRGTKTRKDIGVPVEEEMVEERRERRKVEVHTFKREGEDYLYKLGGSHGKIWGAMKEAAEILAMSGSKSFKDMSFAEIQRLMRSIRIDPTYVKLEGVKHVSVESLPQVLAGKRGRMISQYFDVIDECTARIVLTYPEVFEEQVNDMLKQIQQMNCLNKRRGTIEIIERKELD